MEHAAGSLRKRGSVLCLVMVTSLSGTAYAATRTFTLEYSATGDCPGELEMAREIQRRTPAAERVSYGGDIAAVVRVDSGEGRAHGSIEWREDETLTRRSLDGADCADVVSALSLILVVLLDPDAGVETRPSRKPPDGSAQPQPGETGGPRWSPAFAAIVGVTGGVAPAVRPYLAARVAVRRSPVGIWAPRAELAFLAAQATSRTPSGTADLTWWALRFGLCPVQLSSGGWFLLPCPTFEAGQLSARGYATGNGRSASAPWYGPGVVLRAGYAARGLISAVEAGAVAPLARDRFYFLPDETAARIPRLVGYCGVAMGVEL
jgi:hypothetical protein